MFAALILPHCNKMLILCTAWKSWGSYSCWFFGWQIWSFKCMRLLRWLIVCSFHGQLRLLVHTAGFHLNWASALSWDNLFFSVHSSGVKDTTIKAAKINNVVSWAVNPPKNPTQVTITCNTPVHTAWIHIRHCFEPLKVSPCCCNVLYADL